MGSRSWIARVLKTAVPFVVIVGVFAAAVAWHVSAPGRRVATFHRLIADDAPVVHDYGDAATITMERGPCLKGCPAYVVRIHGSGEVEFDGRAFVCVMHPLTDRVLRVTAQRLIDAMVRVDFDELRREEAPGRVDVVLDGPTTSTTLERGPSRHAVSNDGSRAIPPVVAEIERQIDRVAGTARWKRIPRNDGEQQPFCAMPDGTKKVFDGDGQLVDEADGANRPAAGAASDPGLLAGFEQMVDGHLPTLVAFPDTAFVSLQRTACYGTCPMYTVRVYGSGRVEFAGERFTCGAGPASATVDRASAQRLLNGLAGAGFDRLPDFTRVDRTDAPTTNIEFSNGGRSHKVAHYLGMRDAPPLVDAIEHAIDRVSGDARWLPSHEDGTCARADGTRYRFTRGGDMLDAASSPARR